MPAVCMASGLLLQMAVISTWTRHYVSEDQALLWSAARSWGEGHPRQPNFWGQTYGTTIEIIPAEVPEKQAEAGGAIYEFEPDEDEILAELLPRNISTQIFHALLENAASEQGARMSAMDNATRNAGDMIKKQTLKYNRTRQAMITKELIEIISGAEAL